MGFAPRLGAGRLLATVGLLISLLVLATRANAQGPQSSTPAMKPTTLLLGVSPALGPGSNASDGWMSLSVALENTTETQIQGHLEVRTELGWRSKGHITTRAPFAVAGKGRVRLTLPTHNVEMGSPVIEVRALDGDGNLITSVEAPTFAEAGPLLFNLSAKTKGIAPAIRDTRLPVRFSPAARYGMPGLTVSNAVTKWGDPIVPERASGYSAATIVLATSETVVSKLTGRSLEALTHWVLSGGALAVVVTRPEDLRSGALTRLLGGTITEASPTVSLRGTSPFLVQPDEDTTVGPSTPNIERHAPADGTYESLVSYDGGNLQQTPWGASGTYGLGEVHLLGFDPIEKHVDDPWVHAKMIDLLRHSWDRRAHVALPHGGTPVDRNTVDEIRRLLDPNEGARWAIVVAALLLLLYAVLAGPVNFYLAARKNQPLRALRHLPIWAAGTFLFIVVLGALAKGVSGRARHLSVIESGAGMSHATITRFRGLYASWTRDLTVFASSPGHVLDVAGDPEETPRTIAVDRDATRLEGFRARPWQTVVIREDGFVPLGQGVSVVPKGGSATVKNRLGRDLVAVVVKVPGQRAYYFERIPDGGSVDVGTGEALDPSVGKSAYNDLHELRIDAFQELAEEHAPNFGRAWSAIDNYVFTHVDWWPADVPVVMAQVDGGEGVREDSGLAVDVDRVLLRVVGWGGTL